MEMGKAMALSRDLDSRHLYPLAEELRTQVEEVELLLRKLSGKCLGLLFRSTPKKFSRWKRFSRLRTLS
jgi:hypothetical protein